MYCTLSPSFNMHSWSSYKSLVMLSYLCLPHWSSSITVTYSRTEFLEVYCIFIHLIIVYSRNKGQRVMFLLPVNKLTSLRMWGFHVICSTHPILLMESGLGFFLSEKFNVEKLSQSRGIWPVPDRIWMGLVKSWLRIRFIFLRYENK